MSTTTDGEHSYPLQLPRWDRVGAIPLVMTVVVSLMVALPLMGLLFHIIGEILKTSVPMTLQVLAGIILFCLFMFYSLRDRNRELIHLRVQELVQMKTGKPNGNWTLNAAAAYEAMASTTAQEVRSVTPAFCKKAMREEFAQLAAERALQGPDFIRWHYYMEVSQVTKTAAGKPAAVFYY